MFKKYRVLSRTEVQQLAKDRWAEPMRAENIFLQFSYSFSIQTHWAENTLNRNPKEKSKDNGSNATMTLNTPHFMDFLTHHLNIATLDINRTW